MKRLMAKIENNYTLLNFFILLNICEYNLKVLHWYTIGFDFDDYHTMLEDYYEDMYEYIDLIAEYLMSKDIDIPKYGTIASEEDYKFIDIKPRNNEEIINNCKEMFTYILNYIDKLYETNLDNGIKSKLDEMYFYFDKECNYKLKRKNL